MWSSRTSGGSRRWSARARYVGKLIHELTYAQIQKLDCGTRHPADPATDPFVGTQEAVPGTHMPSLAQVFQLVNRYGADRVQFDIETKRDPTLPKETVGPTTFAKKVIAVISRYHMTKRAVLQSFDWSTLQAARQIKPRLRRAALAQATTIFPGTPWTGGIASNPDALRRRPRARRRRQAPRPGPLGQLPRHHRPPDPQGLARARPDDHPVDRRRAGRHGGADRPRRSTGSSPTTRTRLRDVMAAKELRLPEPFASPFDVEGHRGARRLPAREHARVVPVRALAAGRHARARHRRDQGRRASSSSHDRQVNGVHCTPAAYAGHADPRPTLAQIKTLDCGVTRSGLPRAGRQPGEKMPTLQEVFDLVGRAATTTCASTSRRRSARWSTTRSPYDVFTRQARQGDRGQRPGATGR